jgi:hypothetical protein
MANWIRLGMYVAAGVGTYEILRRYGLLQKAGDWLSQQVPDEYKDQAREYAGQVRDRARHVGEQVRERAGEYGERAQQWANEATETVRSAVGGDGRSSQHTGGAQNLSGAGRGTSTSTDESNGTHVPHTVGRGVVR